MEPIKLLVKDFDKFIKEQRYVYASGQGKQLLVTLHAAPNHERYIIRNIYTEEEYKFKKRGNGIKFFNMYVAERYK